MQIKLEGDDYSISTVIGEHTTHNIAKSKRKKKKKINPAKSEDSVDKIAEVDHDLVEKVAQKLVNNTQR